MTYSTTQSRIPFPSSRTLTANAAATNRYISMAISLIILFLTCVVLSSIISEFSFLFL